MRLTHLVSLCLLAVGCGSAFAQDSAQDIAPAGPTITITPATILGPVNRLVFGHNIEAGNGKDIFSSKKDTNDPIAGRGAWDVANRKPITDTVAWSKAIGLGMLRYPGGCLTHNFDWRNAVGPLSERTYYTFGIDEYIEFCRAVNAEPLMNVSEIAGPVETAGLVEYLNAPADAAHPWAQKRAAWGHPQPYGVKWFEMANESDHGNHDVEPRLKRSAAEYAAWVAECATAMRAVDPAIRIGAHVGTGTPVSDPWNATMLDQVGTKIDFVAVHTYVVGSPAEVEEPSLTMRATMAAADQVVSLLGDYHVLIQTHVGHDLPLAVTEYNAGFAGDKPPYRYCFGAALHSADQLGRMLRPETGVVMANYWQFLNGYWGFLRGNEVPDAGVKWKTTAAAPVFRLWGQHVGTTLVESRVSGVARVEFEGLRKTLPAHGEVAIAPQPQGEVALPFVAMKGAGWTLTPQGSDGAVVDFDQLTDKRYVDLPSFPVHGGFTYHVTWEQRIETLSDVKLGFSPGFGLCDARGWNVTKSACAAHGAATPGDWAVLGADLVTLPDATALRGVVRLEGGATPISGRLALRKVHVTAIKRGSLPAFVPLATTATLADDGKTLHLVVFNKHDTADQTVTLRIAGQPYATARAWCVSGPLTATNLEREEVRETLGGVAVPLAADGSLSWTFPAHSMTAIDFSR